MKLIWVLIKFFKIYKKYFIFLKKLMSFKSNALWILSLLAAFLLLNHSLSILRSDSPFLLDPSNSLPEIDILHDESSLSNINEVRTIHFDLNLTVNFDQKILKGQNKLTLFSLIPSLKEVHLDVSTLSVFEVYDENMNALQYQIEPNPLGVESIGDRLSIKLVKQPKIFEPFQLTISYQTNPNATALNWLTPEQTSSKTQAYLFSQCESIYCRTIAPLQDTPAIKSTYSATIVVPNEINTFMSANLTRKYQFTSELTAYEFKCEIPIPSYLLAIIAGNVTEKQIGPRTFVITEPNDIQVFSKELEDVEKYLITVENYITPYQWGYYKIVILPPSFPFGGMENPLLTFASPSIIAGDKSGIFVVIHEIGHSWTGNWVTCQNWENFWLNEGFTVFLERKGNYILNGYNFYAISSLVGNISLMANFKTFGFNDSFSSLHPDLTGRNPDDAFSTVPYEKGYQFLVYLESLVGEGNFQNFLRAYMHRFAKQSPVYEELVGFFSSYIVDNLKNSSEVLRKVDWNEWIWQPGMPPVDMSGYFRNEVLGEAERLASDFLSSEGETTPNNSEIFNKFDMNLKLLFLQYFIDRIDKVDLKILIKLNDLYHLNNNTNFEIGFAWWHLNVLANNEDVFNLVRSFLGKTGRMKFVRPLYVSLNILHHDLAIEIFNEYERFYHPIAIRLIKQDLNIN